VAPRVFITPPFIRGWGFFYGNLGNCAKGNPHNHLDIVLRRKNMEIKLLFIIVV
jgi:hypothetical protein